MKAAFRVQGVTVSVRRGKFKDRDGVVREHWIVDIVFSHSDGRVERVRKVSPVQTRKGSEEYERQTRAALLAGAYNKKEVPTLATFAKEFLKIYAEANNKPSEIASKERFLQKHLLPALGSKRLDEITVQDIERYKAAKGVSHNPKSVNNHLGVLRRLLGVAQEWGVVEAVPKIKAMKTRAPEVRWLNDDELEKLLAAAEEPWRTAMFVVARTGLRLGEMRALRWVDVDLVRAKLHVRQAAWLGEVGTPKSGKGREVPLSDEALQALKKHPRTLRGGYVFGGHQGALIDTDACQWAIHKVARSAGLGELGWHALRHTFASQLVTRGVHLPVVQRLLGHADIRTTMRYSHLAPCAMSDAVAVLDSPHGKTAAKQLALVKKQ